MKRGAYLTILGIVILGLWILSGINPLEKQAWLIETFLLLFFTPIIIWFVKRFELSKTSCSLIAIYLIFHIYAIHYTYAETPFGYVLQDWMSANRNMYDRLVHFLFGFLWFYPFKEILMKTGKVKGNLTYYFSLDMILAFSAIFELIEFGGVMVGGYEVGMEYMGMQGDFWDAQKDMLLAGIGAVISIFIVFFINFIKNWRTKA
jgi:putative membrane protein